MPASKRMVESVFRHVTGENDLCILSQAWIPAVFTSGEEGQPPRQDAVAGEQLSVTRSVAAACGPRRRPGGAARATGRDAARSSQGARGTAMADVPVRIVGIWVTNDIKISLILITQVFGAP